MTFLKLIKKLESDEKDHEYLKSRFMAFKNVKEKIERFNPAYGEPMDLLNLLEEKKVISESLSGFVKGLAVMDYITPAEYGELLERMV